MSEPAPSPGACELCGGSLRHAFTAGDRNRATTRERFDYERCVRCGTYSLRNVPADLGAYYPQGYYGDEDRGVLERAAAGPIEQEKLAAIRSRVSCGRLIEIGPGGGGFAIAAARAGFAVTGIEMDARACERLERFEGVSAVNSAAPEQAIAELAPSDAIAAWHVLEHLRRPSLTLAAAAANLRPGGVLALAVPNPDALQFRLLGSRWAHVDAPRHLHLLPLAALAAHLSAHGLALVSAASDDLAARHWNRFGWECALRRAPAVRPAAAVNLRLAQALALAASPLERRDMAGATFTAVFAKGD